jgi:separase
VRADRDLRRPDAVPCTTHANFARCVSGAFHNLAGTLYQAERVGYAVRFLRCGCVLGVEALRLAGECGILPEERSAGDEEDRDGDGEGERSADAWRLLREQIARRWELLGVCYSKIADRKVRRFSSPSDRVLTTLATACL